MNVNLKDVSEDDGRLIRTVLRLSGNNRSSTSGAEEGNAKGKQFDSDP